MRDRRGRAVPGRALTPPASRPVTVVFLDRDGTINVKASEGEYVERAAELVLLPGAAAAIRRVNAAGALAVVITNQRGIALGRMTEEDLAAIHARMSAELARAGAVIDAFYHCPHASAACDCRKPHPGMLLAAQRDRPGIDFERAAMIGDAVSDIEAADRVGAMRVLIDPDGSKLEAARRRGIGVDLHVGALDEAVDALAPRLARF